MDYLLRIAARIKGRIIGLWSGFDLRYRKILGRIYVRLSIFEAEMYLRKYGPIRVLIDNSVLGHGITHETAWINTGPSMWGDLVRVNTGYSTRIPVHSPGSTDRIYQEVRYLVGIAELAKLGLIELVTSAELEAERWRQPIGRFRGYGLQDLNVFEGIHMPSVDGHHFDAVDPSAAQQARLAKSKVEPFATLARLFPKKSNLDAWHVHTAHIHNLYCFLAIDFPLVDNLKTTSNIEGFPQLACKVMLPSELAAAIKLRPIETAAISYQDSIWFTHPELSTPSNKRTSPRHGTVNFNTHKRSEAPMETPKPDDAATPGNLLPTVGKMMGIGVNAGSKAVSIHYVDKADNLYQLNMTLGDAMYLLSLLKSTQLSLNIPFPDDPRDPNATAVRPSDAGRFNVPSDRKGEG